ncbi:hypothetical protein KRX52_04475 [Pseudomonas sp. MAP12]|uniref:Gas vesicle protein n=1 Tax=Geopseudomonas aromaticivorans TaxID=2849492 RepID=A0ABS6MTC1_9GAMM|nr:hypothetical protein [Pseudomonas aromaticivorans]MBV2132052.1 hypothetical protein [Pseudomonas aromaticivorans]
MSDAEIRIGTDMPEEGRDWLLQNFVIAAKTDIETPITLFTSSGVVTGRIISGRKYIELLRELLGFGAAPSGMEEVTQNDDAASPEDKGPYFIHLRDAAIVSGVSFTPTEGGLLWRGKLSDVAGFSIGRLEPRRE